MLRKAKASRRWTVNFRARRGVFRLLDLRNRGAPDPGYAQLDAVELTIRKRRGHCGGTRWKAEGNDSCITRLNFPAPTLKAKIDEEGRSLKRSRSCFELLH
jgi:hypothetical protein